MWLALPPLWEIERTTPPAFVETVPPVAEAVQEQRVRIDQALEVTFQNQETDLEARTVTFTDGVEATFGLTSIRCDRLHLDTLNKTGEATGNVSLIDPDGNVQASRITFNWDNQTGTAYDVAIEAPFLRLKARQIHISPESWVLRDVVANTCGNDRPLLVFTAREVTIVPGSRAKVNRLGIEALGQKLGVLPTYTFSLDRRVRGLTAPSIAFERGVGFGVSWASEFMAGPDATIGFNVGVFQSRMPSYSLEYSRSLLGANASMAQIRPRPDVGEHFDFAWLENVLVRNPKDEWYFTHERRSTMSVGTYWNIGVTARREEPTISKPIDVAYEAGGSLSGFGLYGQVRGQQIQETRGRSETRTATFLSVSLPELHIGPNLAYRNRIDTAAFFGERSRFGWGRLETGFAYEPSPHVRLGVGYVDSLSLGSPYFGFDELYSDRGWRARLDLTYGPRKFSYLVKYDASSGRIYDREFMFSQIAGCIEPYIVVRQFPYDLRVGFYFRVEELLNRLKNRDVGRRDSP